VSGRRVLLERGLWERAGEVSSIGLEPVTIGGRSATATHYSLGNGLGRRDFWVDSAGRVLRVETSQGLKAIREELPR